MNNSVKQLNKFLSYVHMGASVFRIYLKEAEDGELIDLLSKHIRTLKDHEEVLTGIISHYQKPCKKMTFMEKKVSMMEKMKVECCHNSDYHLAYLSLKAIHMGLEKGFGFIEKNNEDFSEEFKDIILKIIEYYGEMAEEYKAYMLKVMNLK